MPLHASLSNQREPADKANLQKAPNAAPNVAHLKGSGPSLQALIGEVAEKLIPLRSCFDYRDAEVATPEKLLA